MKLSIKSDYYFIWYIAGTISIVIPDIQGAKMYIEVTEKKKNLGQSVVSVCGKSSVKRIMSPYCIHICAFSSGGESSLFKGLSWPVSLLRQQEDLCQHHLG